MRKLDYLTYGRDTEFGIGLATQTVPVFFSLVIGSVPIFSLPLNSQNRSLLFGLSSLFFAYILYKTIGWISDRTYSVGLRGFRPRIMSFSLYLLMGTIVILAGYLMFVAPHPHPDFSLPDLLLGVSYSLIYAELAAIGLVATVQSEGRRNKLPEEIKKFRILAKEIEEGPKGVDENTPENLAQLGISIADSISDEPASGVEDLDERLTTWVNKFEEETDFMGRKQRVKSDEFSDITDDLYTFV